MSFTSAPLAQALPLPGQDEVFAARQRAIDAERDAKPWWRVPMVWVVISGPLAVVIASLVTAVIAWRHIDPVILDASNGQVIGHAGDEVAAPANPKDPLAPALRARNHSATERGSADAPAKSGSAAQ